MQLLLSECPAEFTSSTMGNIAANRSGQVTVHTLANLRTKLNTTKDRYRMAKAKVETTKRIAYYIEDLGTITTNAYFCTITATVHLCTRTYTYIHTYNATLS